MGIWDKRTARQRLRHFRTDDSGQFAVWFALLAVPLITMLAYVGDITYAGKVEAELKGSLDAAALAAVINQKLTVSERKEFAKIHFNENFTHSDLFNLNVKNASSEKVELLAIGNLPSHIGAMTGRDSISIQAEASSVLTKENIICAMALDPDGEAAFSASSNSYLSAQNCSVQVNSIHDRAAVVETGSVVTAKSICVSGGATGQYSPSANTECSQVEDPYKNLNYVDDKPCTFSGNKGKAAKNVAVVSGVAVAGDNAVLTPGIYCGDVRIDGQDVKLLPGNYVFRDSRLEFRDGSYAIADGVTIILSGKKSEIRISDGSVLYLKAPSVGPMAGLAIFQNTAALGKKAGKLSGKTRIKGDSSLSIVGTVYLPSQRIVIGDGGHSNIQNKTIPESPATSFIAFQIHLEGSKTKVAVNHKSAGLPPVLPRADEGARLVQ